MQRIQAPAPTLQRVFHAPEIWLILQMLDAAEPESGAPAGVPVETGFDGQAVADAREVLLREGILRRDGQGNVQMAYVAYQLVMPSVFPEAVIVATISDRATRDEPGRMICFSRSEDSMVVNWVDDSGDHHFQVYPRQDARLCVLDHLARACDLNVVAPDKTQKAPSVREVELAVEQMKQAVTLMAVTGVGTAAQRTRAAGWFVGGGRAWLMQMPAQGEQAAPRRASVTDIAQTVLSLAELTLERN